MIEKGVFVWYVLVSSSCRCAFFATSIFEIRNSKFVVFQYVNKKVKPDNSSASVYNILLEPISQPSRPIHLNVHIEFDPGMVGKGVLVCCMTSLLKWSIQTIA